MLYNKSLALFSDVIGAPRVNVFHTFPRALVCTSPILHGLPIDTFLCEKKTRSE